MSELLRKRVFAAAGLLVALGVSMTACAPPGATTGTGVAEQDVKEDVDLQADETADGFDLDALVAAAQEEGPITVYDETGKVTQIAEAFTKKYGIGAEGVKIEVNAIDKVRREHDSGNVIADVLAISDPPAFYSQLLREGILTNWVPGDVREELPEYTRYPYLTSNNQMIWTYNSEGNGDTCPVTNIWQLTEPEWKGRVAIPDPESRALYTTAWNQSAREHADEWASAYEDYFGEPLDITELTAFHEWVKRFAENSPTVFKSDEEVSEVVGAPGQDEPPFGLMYAAKYRNNAEKGFALAPCDGMQPFAGASNPQTMAYASKSKSPNAAKLYIHFATSQEGMEFIMPDGKSSFAPGVTHPEDPYGVIKMVEEEQFQPFNTDYLEDDFTNTVVWQDFWRSNRS